MDDLAAGLGGALGGADQRQRPVPPDEISALHPRPAPPGAPGWSGLHPGHDPRVNRLTCFAQA